MQIQLFSDLHIEFEELSVSCEKADVVVFAGDIELGTKGVEWIKRQNIKCPIIYVLGNHEYYKHDMVKLEPLLEKSLQEKTSRTIFSIGKISAAKFDGVRFIYGTAWTDGGADYWENDRVESGMSDFYVIKHDGEPFTVQKMQLIP